MTAAAIANEFRILEDESEACESAVIDSMSDEELKNFVEGISVYARVSPSIRSYRTCMAGKEIS